MPDDRAPFGPARELHVSRRARERYGLDQTLFSFSGRAVVANFHTARILAARINEQRDLTRFPEQAVSAAALNAMGLIDEMLHAMLAYHREQMRPQLLGEAIASLEERLGTDRVDHVLALFTDEFPPVAVFRGELTAEQYLSGSTGGVPHREVALEELLLLWLAVLNPAFAPFRELFDDQRLRTASAYLEVMTAFQSFLEATPGTGSDGQSLFALLRAPALASPDSLEGQLAFIRAHWGDVLGHLLARILRALDFLAEEGKPFFGFGPGPVPVPDFKGLEAEVQAFSPDLHWMPRVVMMAKNIHVWLDQLSRRHGRHLSRLDEIPDQELDVLAASGFTALWLIGVWERSRASERIKRMMGDEEAVASAYSLFDYVVASDLGGWAAFEDLKLRAGRRGIRLATDMVPNHVGIDSRWTIEHPDWFVSLPYSPFPSYTFNGPDLSDDERVGIFLEDHYSSRSDAAVVFKRVDRWTGDARYIYHGNDGTNMPWNDTAQLDYRSPEVREAVIQTILHVARQSPIIRFDAAMTLTKRNFHRLWFPEPGTGGDIPSRAEHGMTREELDAVMPQEFWREVVDRVAAEAPDTLLLAEAFWLLEGYFVRTLGMHRVYNSAFMNMLRDERNADYRQLINNTLDFDPQILKRYVNFMSNPDERTAVDQFGRGDKYFGVATMMATMPGLPMFGHGQVEGFTEKYGMEFRRARFEEDPDQELVRRHRREIFPLLHQRALFAEVGSFQLYDLVTSEGTVDENVFAYSNAAEGKRALVVYHNRFGDTRGFLRTGGGSGGSVSHSLGVSSAANHYLLLRDPVRGLELIRSCQELAQDGLWIELNAYECRTFLELREVVEDELGRYGELARRLGGRAVASIEDERKESSLAPLLGPLRQVLSPQQLERLVRARLAAPGEELDEAVWGELETSVVEMVAAARLQCEGLGDEAAVVAEIRSGLEAVLRLPTLLAPAEEAAEVAPPTAADELLAWLGESVPRWATLLAWAVVRPLGKLLDEAGFVELSRSWMDDWMLARVIARSLATLGMDEEGARRATRLVKLLLDVDGWHRVEGEESEYVATFLRRRMADHDQQSYLGVNRFDGTVWFNRESFDEWLEWLLAMAAVDALRQDAAVDEELATAHRLVTALQAAETASGYRLGALLAACAPSADMAEPDSEPVEPGDGAETAPDEDVTAPEEEEEEE